MKIKNKIELRVVGQMRNGNHAVISWLSKIYGHDKICFLNNIRHGSFDPFENFMQKKLEGFSEEVSLEELRGLDKNILIYSYEDRISLKEEKKEFMESVFDEDFQSSKAKWIGQSKHKFNIYVIRDPFNSLASRFAMIKNEGPYGGLGDFESIKNAWISIAKKVISLNEGLIPHVDHCGHIELVINYNKWMNCREYQQELSEKLLGDFVINLLDDVPPYKGVGISSFYKEEAKPFTKKEFISKWHKIFLPSSWGKIDIYAKRVFASKRKAEDFLTRWKKFSFDDDFQQLFKDGVLLEMSEKIFGEIPETRNFVSKIQKG